MADQNVIYDIDNSPIEAELPDTNQEVTSIDGLPLGITSDGEIVVKVMVVEF